MKKTLLMTLAALGTMTATAYAGTVTVNGSTTVLPAMQQVTESFMAANPDVTVTISGSGSGNGIKALRDKMTDIAMSSRDLKSKEVQDFESHGMKTNRYTVAHDAIIPVVHNNNAVKGLTMLSCATSSPARSRTGRKWAVPTVRSSWSAATPPRARLKAGRNS